MLEDFSLTGDCTRQLEEWFCAKAPARSIGGAGDREIIATEKKLLSVLDSKRTQTMLIVLAKINKTPEEIVEMSKKNFRV